MYENSEGRKSMQKWKEASLNEEQETRMLASSEAESTSFRSLDPWREFGLLPNIRGNQ